MAANDGTTTSNPNKRNKNADLQYLEDTGVNPLDETQEDEYLTADQEEATGKAVNKCAEWLTEDRSAKEFYVDEMEEMDRLYRCDHWGLTGPNGTVLRTTEQQEVRPNTVENYAFAMVEGLVAEFAQDVDLVDYPVEKDDDQIANVMSDLKKFILYKNRFETESQKFRRHLFKYGTGILEPLWDPDWKGGRGPNKWHGEIRVRTLHPQFAFPDARCLDDLNTGRRFHKAVVVTLEYIRELFPTTGRKVQAETVTDYLIGDEDELENASNESRIDSDQALLVETWYKGRPLILGTDEDGQQEEDQGPGLHVIWWANESQRIYLKHANYVHFDPGEEAEFPFILRQCYPRENSVWGYGEMYFLKSPQIALNKTTELILEGHMHHCLGQTFYNEGALSAKQEKEVRQYGTLPGMWFKVQDMEGIKREFGQGVPGSLLNESNRLQKVMESIVGRFDISQGKTPGSVTAFKALDLLAERAQVRLRTKELTIRTANEDLGNYINRLITRNYTEKRAYRILGEDEQGRRVLKDRGVFDLGGIQKVYVPETGEVGRLQDFQPPEGWVEGEQYEIYSPEFDVECRTTTTMPSDRIFYMEMAKELLAAQIIDQETFFYVLEKGKFPPYAEILEKLQQQQAQQQEMEMQAQQQQMQAAVPPPGPPAPTVKPVGPIKFSMSSSDPNVILTTLQDVMAQAEAMGTMLPGQEIPGMEGQGVPGMEGQGVPGMEGMQAPGGPGAGQQPGPEVIQALLAEMPPELQAQFMQLTPEQQMAVLAEMMAGGGGDYGA